MKPSAKSAKALDIKNAKLSIKKVLRLIGFDGHIESMLVFKQKIIVYVAIEQKAKCFFITHKEVTDFSNINLGGMGNHPKVKVWCFQSELSHIKTELEACSFSVLDDIVSKLSGDDFGELYKLPHTEPNE